MWKSEPVLFLVNEASALPIINGTNIRRIESVDTQFKRPKNNIGLNFHMGFGMKSEAIYELDNGTNSKFSFGGGVGAELRYARELSKYFDLQIGASYLMSSLRPSLKAAKMDFSRAKVSLTPHILIPIRDGETTRFRMGGGMDYYFWNKLKIEDPISPLYDTWKYDNRLGYHAVFLFDMIVQQNFSFTYGLNWTGVGFNFMSSGNSIPIDQFFSNPNGNGINLVIGMSYYF